MSFELALENFVLKDLSTTENGGLSMILKVDITQRINADCDYKQNIENVTFSKRRIRAIPLVFSCCSNLRFASDSFWEA